MAHPYADKMQGGARAKAICKADGGRLTTSTGQTPTPKGDVKAIPIAQTIGAHRSQDDLDKKSSAYRQANKATMGNGPVP